ncbi:MAG: hypothetical protein H0U10_01670, partial [Chloroflexia bacterium]|nr:hypothetical protein [Chloroflexia bacterium]
GAFVPGVPGNRDRLDAFAKRTGHEPAIVMWYQHWGFPDTKEFDPKLLANASAHGATPMITWEPWDTIQGANSFPLRQIAAGDFDPYVRTWADGLATFERPVYLRFGHEMNGTWYPWCVGQNRNTAEDYVQAWKHLRDVFVEKKADNVRWVWSPNVSYNGSAPLDNVLYPGDAFVDWIGIDGYNWGTQTDDHRWQSFAKVFGPTLAEIDAIAPAKPVMIAETASAEEGGDKAAWVRSALLHDLPLRYPKVRALVWFDEEKERDWTVDSSEATLREFRAAAAHPYYDSPPTDQRVSATRRGDSGRRSGTDEDRRRRQGSGQRGRRDRRQA